MLSALQSRTMELRNEATSHCDKHMSFISYSRFLRQYDLDYFNKGKTWPRSKVPVGHLRHIACRHCLQTHCLQTHDLQIRGMENRHRGGPRPGAASVGHGPWVGDTGAHVQSLTGPQGPIKVTFAVCRLGLFTVARPA